ncbi:uncharacterized protein LOC110933723 [Helianthus annuus]|uniref:uncharacterized protein LOC110933723 n=1 Tax=Helianthus annuus TaxID=4232 RepID=UPI000B8F4FD7|nr:uncharacterized protein LOC110933723 [Helianthus annuus]
MSLNYWEFVKQYVVLGGGLQMGLYVRRVLVFFWVGIQILLMCSKGYSYSYDTNKAMMCSFVYADNYYIERRKLWESLCLHKLFVKDKLWVILGDFNSSLFLENLAMGTSKISTGLKSRKRELALKKIDRVMANVYFTDEFSSACAVFQPYRISDHTPCILKIPGTRLSKPKPFKFFNFIVYKKDFGDIVKAEWSKHINGVPMFRMVKKLKAVKHPIRSLLFKQGNLHKKVKSLREELDEVQKKIDSNPADLLLRESESAILASYQEALLDEERLKQKSKVDWLKVGDVNSAYFHNSVKCRNHRSRVDIIKDVAGNVYEGNDVPNAFVNHFTAFLGQKGDTTSMPTPELFPNVLETHVAEHMVREVTNVEIKAAMFSIDENKAPGPDGYSSAFFKKAWPIVGNDVCDTIKHFFNSKRMLKEVNNTIIALIPKVTTPCRVTDYRPISCCNVLYKCITKILSTRILEGLDKAGQRPPRCAFKVDIQKAYDTVDWDFLSAILNGFGFHQNMIDWIMKCITSRLFQCA